MSTSVSEMLRQLSLVSIIPGYTDALEFGTTASDNSMLQTDFVFPHSYEIEGVPGVPSTGQFDVPVHYIPRPSNRREHNGLWLKVVPDTGNFWIGVFAFLFDSPHNFSRVVSTPDPNRVCVISGSAGYLVSVEKPAT